MVVSKNSRQIFCAIDTDDLEAAKSLSSSIRHFVGGIKIGSQFFCTYGPPGLEIMRALGLPVFLDLKLFDIPNTVAAAVVSAGKFNPFMMTLHASGGKAMMRAAVDANKTAADASGTDKPLLLGVTVLTSFDESDLDEIGVKSRVLDQVSRLALLAQASGLDGVVCSAHEIEILRSRCGNDFKLVVPGIRPTWASTQDQKRVLSPSEAIARGADYLVIGRPITSAENPSAAARQIASELSNLETPS